MDFYVCPGQYHVYVAAESRSNSIVCLPGLDLVLDQEADHVKESLWVSCVYTILTLFSVGHEWEWRHVLEGDSRNMKLSDGGIIRLLFSAEVSEVAMVKVISKECKIFPLHDQLEAEVTGSALGF